MRKGKSIRKNLILKISILSILVLGTSFAGTFFMVGPKLDDIKIQSVSRIINDQSMLIEEKLNNLISISQSLANNAIIADMSVPVEDKLEILSKYQEDFGFRSIGHADAEGNLTATDGFTNDISQKEYFIKPMGDYDYFLSNPSFVKGTTEQIAFVAVPIKNGNEKVGVLTCTFYSDFLSNSIKGLKYFGGYGKSYIINGQGLIMASDDFDEVTNARNIIQEAEEDSSLKELSEIHKKMISGESGFETYNDGTYKVVVFTPINGTNGWSMALEIDEGIFYKESIQIMIIFFAACVFGIIALILVS